MLLFLLSLCKFHERFQTIFHAIIHSLAKNNNRLIFVKFLICCTGLLTDLFKRNKLL